MRSNHEAAALQGLILRDAPQKRRFSG